VIILTKHSDQERVVFGVRCLFVFIIWEIPAQGILG
jgi:hypothetical protein